MYHRDNCYKDLPNTELWTLLTLGHYALYKIQEKYDTENTIRRPTICGLVQDGRRYPTVRRFLVDNNLIKDSYRTDTIMDFIDEEIEKLLAGSMKEPEFNTSGYITKKEHSWSNEEKIPVTDLGEVFIDVEKFNAYEIIYVYLHQDEYDFRMFSTKTITSNHRNRYSYSSSSSEYTHHDLKIYPLAEMSGAGDASLIAAGESYSIAHAKEILTATFGLTFRAIDDSKEFMTLEAVNERVEKVEEKLRLLRRTCKELKVLRRKAAKLGDEALSKSIIDTGLNYVRRSAPLWLNSDDEEKKNLATLLCKGTNIITEKTVRY